MLDLYEQLKISRCIHRSMGLAVRARGVQGGRVARATKIIRNLYRDSVSLMQLSAALARLDGIEQALAVIASPSNLALLREAGLLGEAAIAAGPNDLLIALLGRDEPA